MQIDGLFSGVIKLHIVKNPSCKIVSQQKETEQIQKKKKNYNNNYDCAYGVNILELVTCNIM